VLVLEATVEDEATYLSMMVDVRMMGAMRTRIASHMTCISFEE
jgi:uncharacterized protein with GYD domain